MDCMILSQFLVVLCILKTWLMVGFGFPEHYISILHDKVALCAWVLGFIGTSKYESIVEGCDNFSTKCGFSTSARQVLVELPEQHVPYWTALIQGFGAWDNGWDGGEFLENVNYYVKSWLLAQSILMECLIEYHGTISFISMMIGLTKPTSGMTFFQGLNIRIHMDGIYTSMGVCPRYDLFWESLKGGENMFFYGRLQTLTALSVALFRALYLTARWEKNSESFLSYSRKSKQCCATSHRVVSKDPSVAANLTLRVTTLRTFEAQDNNPKSCLTNKNHKLKRWGDLEFEMPLELALFAIAIGCPEIKVGSAIMGSSCCIAAKDYRNWWPVLLGGIGDVVGSLPKAVTRHGHGVMVVAPWYSNYVEHHDTGVHKTYKVDGHEVEVRCFQAYIDGVDFIFIESLDFHHLERTIYGGGRLDILKRKVLGHVPCDGVWSEAYCNETNLTGQWVHINGVKFICDGCKNPLRYVVCFAGQGTNYASHRFCMKWSTIASQRVTSIQWDPGRCSVVHWQRQLELEITGVDDIEFVQAGHKHNPEDKYPFDLFEDKIIFKGDGNDTCRLHAESVSHKGSGPSEDNNIRPKGFTRNHPTYRIMFSPFYMLTHFISSNAFVIYFINSLSLWVSCLGPTSRM